MGDVVVKSMVTATVIISRVMQLASFLLMAGMVFLMAQSFWGTRPGAGGYPVHGGGVQLRNGLYVGFAGITLFMGAHLVSLDSLKTGAGGGMRMKEIRYGEEALCRFFSAWRQSWRRQWSCRRYRLKPRRGEGWQGAAAAMEAVNSHRDILFLGSTAGAVLFSGEKAAPGLSRFAAALLNIRILWQTIFFPSAGVLLRRTPAFFKNTGKVGDIGKSTLPGRQINRKRLICEQILGFSRRTERRSA